MACGGCGELDRAYKSGLFSNSDAKNVDELVPSPCEGQMFSGNSGVLPNQIKWIIVGISIVSAFVANKLSPLF